jgi:hypothetical protein
MKPSSALAWLFQAPAALPRQLSTRSSEHFAGYFAPPAHNHSTILLVKSQAVGKNARNPFVLAYLQVTPLEWHICSDC